MLINTVKKFHKQYSCVTCRSAKTLTIDHIVAKSRNGANHLGNYQVMCRKCNENKDAAPRDKNTYFPGIAIQELWSILVNDAYKGQNLGVFLDALLKSSVRTRNDYSIIPESELPKLVEYCSTYGINIKGSIRVRLFDKTASLKLVSKVDPDFVLPKKANDCFINKCLTFIS